MAAYPSLAGQLPTYLFKQLLDYADHSRENPIMSGLAKTLSKQDAADMAAWFASLPATSRNADGTHENAERLAAKGDNERMLAPCEVCHGSSEAYGQVLVLRGIDLGVASHEVVCLIGPSGCGKSTLLRCINRLNDLIDGVRVSGEIRFEGRDVFDPAVEINALRKRIGMVFQKSNPFPKSIYENVAYGLRIQGVKRRSVLDEVVERSLRGAALWDEVKDRLDESALGMSGGQQQRLCIARVIAVEPEVILLDEPCSALDPIATAKIEELMEDLNF